MQEKTKQLKKHLKTITLFNARKFYKTIRMILIGFENDIFPLPKQNPLSAYNWEKNEMNLSEFLPERDEEFYTPKELTTRNKISYFGIRKIFEN